MNKQKLKERALKKLNPHPYPNDESTVIVSISGYTVLLDREDLDRVAEVGIWHIVKNRSLYAVCTIHTEPRYSLCLHKFLLNAPVEKCVDHINLNTLDNRKANLRICSDSENQWNRRRNKNNSTGYKGVHQRQDGTYRAQIGVNKKRINLGSFSSPQEAYAAYCESSVKYHGEFGRVL